MDNVQKPNNSEYLPMFRQNLQPQYSGPTAFFYAEGGSRCLENVGTYLTITRHLK
jgi:hypothetical protein